MRQRTGVLAGLLGGVLLLAGCGVYSFQEGRLREGLESIAVPVFENRTTEPGIEVDLTQDIVEGLINDRTLQIVDRSAADAVLLATIRRYNIGEEFFGGDRAADQYRVQMSVEVEIVDQDTGEAIIGPETLNESATYSIDGGQQAELDARAEVVDGIVRKIRGMVLEGW